MGPFFVGTDWKPSPYSFPDTSSYNLFPIALDWVKAMGKTCKKCGYTATEADSSTGVMCPKCGAVYAKVEAHLQDLEDQRAENARKEELAKAEALFQEEKRSRLPSTLIKTYEGRQSEATDDFMRHAKRLAEDGYVATSQSYAPGSYSGAAYFLAVFLCIFGIGFLILGYMLIVKPKGVLTVTYERKEISSAPASLKKCPRCAETVKKEAQVCRFCGFEFSSPQVPTT